jgi:hypothetical protein
VDLSGLLANQVVPAQDFVYALIDFRELVRSLSEVSGVFELVSKLKRVVLRRKSLETHVLRRQITLKAKEIFELETAYQKGVTITELATP